MNVAVPRKHVLRQIFPKDHKYLPALGSRSIRVKLSLFQIPSSFRKSILGEPAMPIPSSASASAVPWRSKWSATAASALIQCSAGASYCFGVYSPVLKSSQGYDQSTLDSVAFFKDVGANVGVLSGLLISSTWASSRPWIVLAVGAAQCFVGYFFMWLSVTGAVPRPPPLLMGLYLLLAAHSQTFFNTANVVVAVENFPASRGTVIGIMKGFLGLSGAILIQIYMTVLNANPSSLILMLALLPATLTLALMSFVEVYHGSVGSVKKFLDAYSLISLSLAGYLLLLIIGESAFTMRTVVKILTLAALLLLVISPLVVAVSAQISESKIQPDDCSYERIPIVDDSSTKIPEETSYDQGLIPLPVEENASPLQAMLMLDFWLLFLSMACGMGSGLATVNNISQIGGALGYSSMERSTLVSLWSIWNYLGRFGAGYISDYYLRINGCPRPLFIAITLAIMSIGHTVISSGFRGSLYVGSVVVGICYGSQWALMPSITSEIFGLRHFGTIFNTIAIASPFGSYILSVRVVGYIYDIESSGMPTCSGRHCFMLSFLIMGSVCFAGALLSLLLFIRTRRLYEEVIFARVHISDLE